MGYSICKCAYVIIIFYLLVPTRKTYNNQTVVYCCPGIVSSIVWFEWGHSKPSDCFSLCVIIVLCFVCFFFSSFFSVKIVACWWLVDNVRQVIFKWLATAHIDDGRLTAYFSAFLLFFRSIVTTKFSSLSKSYKHPQCVLTLKCRTKKKILARKGQHRRRIRFTEIYMYCMSKDIDSLALHNSVAAAQLLL